MYYITSHHIVSYIILYHIIYILYYISYHILYYIIYFYYYSHLRICLLSDLYPSGLRTEIV